MSHRIRRRLAGLLLTAALAALVALAIPTATIASGGGSAGDQQYTDPFAGSSTTTGATATHTQTSSSPTTTAVAPPQTVTAAAPSSTAEPTATIAHGTLPYTGYEGWLAAACGFTLVAGGVALKVRLRRS